MNRISQLITAKRHGIVIPYKAMRAADNAGIPYPVLCAFLEQESAGGHNEFGHDPTIFVGAGKVTKAKYLEYKKQRDANKANRRMQGVGPAQLTFWSYQDRADQLGGCWNDYINTYVGATILRGLWNHFKDWEQVALAYNGAQSYATQMVARIAKWNKLLA